MSGGRRARVPVLAAGIALLLILSSLPAGAAGKKIFITKTDENFNGHAGVTFELYQDTDGDGVLDPGEPKLDSQVTDNAGKATFQNVAAGNYIVHEVAPAGYNQPPDEAVKIGRKNKEIVFSNTKKAPNNRVNDPTGDTSVDDGTHVFDFGPSIGVAPNGDVLIGWNRSAGFGGPNISGTTTGLSTNGGATWGTYSEPPTGNSALILGEPTVLYDHLADRWLVANAAVINTPQGLRNPIFVSASGGPFGFWNTPVNVYPNIPAQAVAHGPELVFNARNANRFLLTFTRSNGDGTSDTMVTRSQDGATWTNPFSVSGSGHNDFADAAVGRNGNLYVAWTDFTDPADNTFRISRSTDGGITWRPARDIATVPKSGTPGACTDSSLRTYFGQVATFDAPTIAVDPSDPNRVFAGFPGHGPGGDEGDVFFLTSHDGGKTWTESQPVGPTEGTQFAPELGITPDGRGGIGFYSGTFTPDPEVDLELAFLSAFATGLTGETQTVTDQPFPIWRMDPSFDTHYSNCFGMPPVGLNAAGSGFYVAWADGRDPGPVGNGGIDPNLYFANTEGFRLDTKATFDVAKTAQKLKVSGDVSPEPLPGGPVSITLFRNSGGGFEQVGSKGASTNKAGEFGASFARPNGGQCRVIVVFEGSEGREPSPTVTKTFAC
jgi:prealbumin domain-containing protein